MSLPNLTSRSLFLRTPETSVNAGLLSARFTHVPIPTFASVATLRWSEPTGPDTWDDLGFSSGDYGSGGSGIFIFPSGSQGDYFITAFVEAEKSGTMLLQLDDMGAAIFESEASPASESTGRLSLATVHRFYYYLDNPLGGNVGFSVGLYDSSGLDVTLLNATLTVTKQRSI